MYVPDQLLVNVVERKSSPPQPTSWWYRVPSPVTLAATTLIFRRQVSIALVLADQP